MASRSTSWRSAPAATASPNMRGGATSCPSPCRARRSRPSRATSAARGSPPIWWRCWRRRAIARRRPARTSRSAAAAPCSIGGATPTPPGRSSLIARALAQRGVDAPRFEPPLVGAPGERRRADFVLRRQGRRVLAGFHERASPRIVDVGSLRRRPADPRRAARAVARRPLRRSCRMARRPMPS